MTLDSGMTKNGMEEIGNFTSPEEQQYMIQVWQMTELVDKLKLSSGGGGGGGSTKSEGRDGGGVGAKSAVFGSGSVAVTSNSGGGGGGVEGAKKKGSLNETYGGAGGGRNGFLKKEMDKSLSKKEEEVEVNPNLGIMIRCRLGRLKQAESLVSAAPKNKFRIVYYNKGKFTDFHVMTWDTYENEYFQLRECIMEVVEDNKAKLKRRPMNNDIILAPNSMHNGEYHRAAVFSISLYSPNKIGVHFFDVGGYEIVDLAYLRPVTTEIMQFPILGYSVELEGFNAKTTLAEEGILMSDFDKLMESKKNTKFGLKTLLPDVNQKEHLLKLDYDLNWMFKKHKVVLISTEGRKRKWVNGQPQTMGWLEEEIKRLGLWEWEKIARGGETTDENAVNTARRLTDNDMIMKIGTMPGNEQVAVIFPLKLDSELTVQFSSFMSESQVQIRVTDLDDPHYINSFKVIHRQIERYCSMVEKSRFFPAIRKPALFMVDESKEYSKFNIKYRGKWCRAHLIDKKKVYLIDLDCYIDLNQLDSDAYDFRPILREFLSVPMLVVRINPLEKGRPMNPARAKELFNVCNRYTFKIIQERDDGSYDAEYIRAVPN